MAKPPAVDNSYVQLTFKCSENELVALKRAKKEPGALTGKSVVVLKPCDVVERDGTVFMPNTIEMAQLKKSEKGQFKTNVQISSKMSESDIKLILVETFPFLENKRFYCAGAADNRTRLDFHGDRRIWDGRLIKQKIKGNSALYIYTDEGSVEKLELKAPKFSELTTLKRSHDQITSPGNETAERSPKIQGGSEDALEPLKNFPAGAEKHAKRYAASDSRDSSYATAGTFGQEGLPREEITVKKSDQPNPIEGLSQLRQKLPDRVAGVSSQPGIMLPGSQSNKLTSVQDSMNTRDTSAVPGHSMQMGAMMFPQMVGPGVLIAQSGLRPNGLVEARHTGLPFVTHAVQQTMVSSSLTPSMNKLKISLENPQLLQKQVNTEKRDQSAQTVECIGRPPHDSHGRSETASLAQSSETSDSGVETSDSIGVNDEFNLELLSGVALSNSELAVNEICPRSSSLEGGVPFTLIFNKNLPHDVESAIARFGNHGAVPLIKLNELNMRGRVPAGQAPGHVAVKVQTFSGRLLGETTFEYVDEVEHVLQILLRDRKLQARYFYLLAEKLTSKPSETDDNTHEPPNSQVTGRTAKESDYEADDEASSSSDDEWNFYLGTLDYNHYEIETKKTNQTDHFDLCGEPDSIRKLFASQLMGAPRHQSRNKEPTLWKTYQRDNFDLREELGSTRTLCASQLMEAPRHQNRNIEPALWKTNHTDHRDLYEELDGTREICASQLMEAPRYQNRHKESTLTTDKSKEYCHIQDNNGGEQSIEIMNFISLLKTEDVAVKDSVDDISSNLQETRTAISPLNSSVLRVRDHTETPEFVSQGRQDEKRIKNTQDPEIAHEQLNCSDTNENSLSDKSRRANYLKERNQMNNNPAEDL
ncbi:uncharacterized protein [Porites lutea]|uniref:uncharacterized protein n=1 Tax=Porites lutea TaxID=51062 RepID=UPI003CC55091